MYAAAALSILTALASIGVECAAIADPESFGSENGHSGGGYLAAESIQMGANAAAATAGVAGVATRYQNIVAMNVTHDEMMGAIELARKNYPLEERIAENKAGTYRRLERHDDALAKSSFILYTIAAIDVLSLMAGLGPPYEGAGLCVSSDHFSTVYDQLATAFPSTDWQGRAAHTYAGRNTDQQNRAQTMADLDSQLASCIKVQADCVTYIRMILGIVTLLLAAAYCYEVWMRLSPPPGGVIAANSYAIKASLLGLTAGIAALTAATVVSGLTGHAVNNLASQYDDAARRADTYISPSPEIADATRRAPASPVLSLTQITLPVSPTAHLEQGRQQINGAPRPTHRQPRPRGIPLAPQDHETPASNSAPFAGAAPVEAGLNLAHRPPVDGYTSQTYNNVPGFERLNSG